MDGESEPACQIAGQYTPSTVIIRKHTRTRRPIALPGPLKWSVFNNLTELFYGRIALRPLPIINTPYCSDSSAVNANDRISCYVLHVATLQNK